MTVTDPQSKMRIALIGECLIELNGTLFGRMHQSFGGDTLNTAIYLSRIARAAVDVSYVTAIGTDRLSQGLFERWEGEGIDTRLVLRDPSRRPGLYLVHLDPSGEREFTYWRGESAARFLLQHSDSERVLAELSRFSAIYLSGISLAILPFDDRERLLERIRRLALDGVTVAFDSNYRPVLWPNLEAARAAVMGLLPSVSLMLTTFDDEQRLWSDESPESCIARLHAAGVQKVVVKLGAAGAMYSDGKTTVRVAAAVSAGVVDTTAAGDAFNAGFLAGWSMGHDMALSCRIGNALAGVVIRHPGAIVPVEVTPTMNELLTHI